MKITIARSYDLDGLYINNALTVQKYYIDIDDILIVAGKNQFTLERKYLDESWVVQRGYRLPYWEYELELDDRI